MTFAVLLWLEWKYQIRSLRLVALSLSLVVLFFAQPGYTRAARGALVTPPAERVTHVRGEVLSEYVSGVRTMERAVGEDAKMGANARLLSLGVMLWLASTPLFRRKRQEAVAVPGRKIRRTSE